MAVLLAKTCDHKVGMDGEYNDVNDSEVNTIITWMIGIMMWIRRSMTIIIHFE